VDEIDKPDSPSKAGLPGYRRAADGVRDDPDYEVDAE